MSEFMLFVDSSNSVELEPEWGFTTKDKKIENRHRVRSGEEYVYKWGSYEKVKFKVSYVNSSNKSIVNSWWVSNTELLFTVDSGASVSSVFITNKDTPIGKYNKPYSSLFKGAIELSTY